MARRKANDSLLSLDAIAEQISDGLRQQASRPNLYAYHPHRKQYIFHSSQRKVILYIGGNRSGKTTGGAVESIYRLMGKHPYKAVPPAPIRGRAHAVDFSYGVDQIILPEIARWMPPSFLKNGSWEDSYDNQHRVLTLANKSFLEFKSYDQDLEKFAGTSRHFNWYDEEPPRHIYNESQARLVDTDGDAWLTMTPVEGMSWVFDDIYEPGVNGDENILVVEISTDENPHIGKRALEAFLRTLDPEERKAREHGEFVAMGGRVFKSFDVNTHVVEAFTPPKNWRWYVSIDHGYNNPTAILFHAVSPDDDIVTFAEHYKSEMTVDGHAKILKDMIRGFGKEPEYIVGDPAMAQRSGITGTSITQEYADRGIFVAKANNDVDSGVNRMVRYLESGKWHITENCSNLIGEMKKLRWATFASRKMQYQQNKQEKIHKKDDHACDSTRYFFSFMPDLSPDVKLDTSPRPLGNNTGVNPASQMDMLLAASSNKTEWNVAEGTELYAMEY